MTSYYTSTARPTLTSLKPSGSKIVQDPTDRQLISLVSPNVATPITSSFPVPVPPSLMPDASGPKKALLTILLKDPLLEQEEYPTEEVGMVDSLEEEAMAVAEISQGKWRRTSRRTTMQWTRWTGWPPQPSRTTRPNRTSWTSSSPMTHTR